MKRKYIIGFMILAGFSLLASCLDKIAFVRPDGESKELVIQALLTKGEPNVVQVFISDIFDQSGFVNPKPVSVNQVTVINDKGQSRPLEAVSNGNYEVRIFDGDMDFTIDFQTSYKIFVRTINGEEYESSFETLTKVPKMEKLEVKVIDKEIYVPDLDRINKFPFLQFSISTPLQSPDGNGKASLKWDFVETYKFTDTPTRSSVEMKTCFITEIADLDNLPLVNGAETSLGRLEDYLVYERPISSVLAEGYYLSVIQQSLSSNAFDYWDQLKQVIERTGNMFEAPAGNILSNFQTTNDAERPVTGFFYTSESDTLRIFISPEQVGNPDFACPPPITPPGFGCTLGLCCDCLQISGSTTVKPHFWVE